MGIQILFGQGPYDITINARSAGTKEVSYQVLPGETRSSDTGSLQNINPRSRLMRSLQGCWRIKVVASPKSSGR